jgi:multidrug efflux pump subunit AcrA (membrane-fusion protein)
MFIFKYIKRHILLVSIFTICIIVGGFFLVRTASQRQTDWTTSEVTRGDVRNIVSISGTVNAVDTAELGFPTAGTLASIEVTEGDTVTTGQTLATLTYNDLRAEYDDTYAVLLIAQADRNELITGMRTEERNISTTNADIAREDLTRITKEQKERTQNAYRTLLSTDLEAFPENSSIERSFPIVSGTYTCEEGVYTLTVFKSNASSGYSYRLSGLENGTYSVRTDAPALLGACGLQIQFADGEIYGNTVWNIEIPNKRSSSYITNANAYSLALTQEKNAIAEARQALILAEQNNTLKTADPRTEALSRTEAYVLQAQARVDAVSAKIQEHILVAPFNGIVTKIDLAVGESVTTAPILTMASDAAYVLTALVPEIDITKVALGQKAEVRIDARESEIVSTTVTFISPLARKIDGVSYFEAKLTFDGPIPWLRSGLNADVDIVIEAHTDVVRIPKRYLVETDGSRSVLIPNDTETTQRPVRVVFTGNDGYIEVADIEPGTIIVAP